MKKNKFYVTTPIYYVNSKPHLGTLYSTILADATARWHKILGKEVFFLTGTDEHGQKLQEKAQEVGKKPKEFVDSMIPPFKKTWEKYNLEYDKFIRTTDPEHEKAVVQWIKKLLEQDDIYKSEYSGWYCVPCERFVNVESEEVKDKKGNYLCPVCERKLKELAEESYFFRLSAYEDKLLEFYEQNPNFITPKERLNEVISFVKSGLKDLSISRLKKSVSWGIPFPGDKDHTIYVWGDALNNYISAIGFGSDEEKFNKWWPADLHIMAKDIVRFHAVYWPAFLMAAELELPKRLLVHGYILMGDKKMSKSLGNVIDPDLLAEWYGIDQVRYYLLRQMPITQDGSFDLKGLEEHVNSELANNLGNLLNRTATLALSNKLATVEPPENWSRPASILRGKCEEAFRMYWEEMNKNYYHIALSELWRFISEVNSFFHSQEPWKLAKQDKEEFAQTIAATCHSLYAIAIMLWPIMPTKMEELLAALGHKLELGTNYENELRKNLWNKTFTLTKTKKPLFARVEKLKEIEKAAEKQAKEKDESKEASTYIDITDFAKVEMYVGTIKTCEPIEGSTKMYKLSVDLGKLGKRQVLSGVAKSFKPEDLIGKQGVYVTNLKPRKMMGLESQGMMLFAKDNNGMTFVTVGDNIENGTRLS